MKKWKPWTCNNNQLLKDVRRLMKMCVKGETRNLRKSSVSEKRFLSLSLCPEDKFPHSVYCTLPTNWFWFKPESGPISCDPYLILENLIEVASVTEVCLSVTARNSRVRNGTVGALRGGRQGEHFIWKDYWRQPCPLSSAARAPSLWS